MSSVSQSGPQPTAPSSNGESAGPAVTDAQLQSALDSSIWYLLSLWPALHIACANNWGGPDTSDKRDWFAGAVSELVSALPTPPSITPTPTTTTTTDSAVPVPAPGAVAAANIDYLSDFLVQVMTDEFDCNVEDETEERVAAEILGVRARLWGERSLAAARAVERRWRNRGVLRADVRVQDVDQDVDDDDGGEYEDEDEEMGEAPALVSAGPPREKPVPEVDEDGFTKVVSKKKR